jgi:myosin protein heavy chain
MGTPTYEAAAPDIAKTVDLAQRFDSSQQALRVANERCAMMETQLRTLRERHGEEIADIDARHGDSRRAFLEEMSVPQVNARSSPIPFRGAVDRKPFSPVTTPKTQRHISDATNDSARSDRTVDTMAYNSRMDLASELELVQNQLQMSEMKNRHLQNQIDRSPTKSGWEEESPSLRRVIKLERENSRLHDMLDDSAKKMSALEHSIRTGQLSLKEVQTKSHEELYDLINSQEQSRKSLVQAHNNTINELADAKTTFEDIKHTKAQLEVELRDSKSELSELTHQQEQEAANHSQLLQEFSDLQIRLDGETSKLLDVTSSMNLYKSRADEYFGKLEQAEIAVLKANRAEQFAKSQAREAEESCAQIMAERTTIDGSFEDLQRQAQQYEERVEDLSADLESALQSKRRLHNELEDYRSQRAIDIEDKETSFEQTRKKYQGELANVSNELEIERENVIYAREENGRLREEIEELRGKWDDEVLNSSAWAKEKSRLEIMMQEINSSRDEAVSAHNEAQTKIVNLLSQVRTLRNGVDDVSAERDAILKEKKGVEARLAETVERLEDLMRSESPSMRNAAAVDRDLLELKASLVQQEDIVSAAVGKMRRAEALAQETQKDLQAERDANVQLHKEKAAIEKNAKDMQLKLVDLETKGYSSASQDVRFLHGRIQEVCLHAVFLHHSMPHKP